MLHRAPVHISARPPASSPEVLLLQALPHVGAVATVAEAAQMDLGGEDGMAAAAEEWDVAGLVSLAGLGAAGRQNSVGVLHIWTPLAWVRRAVL